MESTDRANTWRSWPTANTAGTDLSSHGVDRPRPHLAIVADGKHGGDRDPTLLLGIEQVPLGNDSPVDIAQEIERNEQLRLKESGSGERVDRHPHDIESGFPKLIRMIPKVRQLADAKRSPITAIEVQNNRANGDHPLELPDLPAGVGKLEVRRYPADPWDTGTPGRLLVFHRGALLKGLDHPRRIQSTRATRHG